MWVFLKDGFLSIVVPQEQDVPAKMKAMHEDGSLLVVRARRRGEIERVFRYAKVEAWRGRDYAFRAFIPRHVVAKTMARLVYELNATNFKSSVKDDARHDAYMDVWSVMQRYQNGDYHRRSHGRRSYGWWGRSRFERDDMGYGSLFGSNDL